MHEVGEVEGVEAARPESEVRSGVRGGVVTLVVGLLVVVAAGPIADLIEVLLPVRGEVSSRGTAFRSFADVGEQVVRRTGVVVVLAALVGLVAGQVRWSPDGRLHRSVGLVTAPLLMVAGAVWYGWLGNPHNGFPTNARIHWVDFETSRVDDFFYAAGRLPHWIFYDVPYVWQAINAAIVVGLSYAIARRLGLSVVPAAAMGATPLVATNLLLFADTAEDVLLNTALLLFVCLAALRREPLTLGIALTMAVLGRPSFLILGACVAAGEALTELRHTRSLREAARGLLSRYVVVTGTVTVAGIILSQAVMEILGDRYFFVDGKIIDTGPLSSAEPVEVEGFVISAFSGAYLAHLVWMMPLTFLIGTVYAVVRAPRLPEPVERFVSFGAVAAVVVLVVHESQPLLYYNVRYLTYVWPFLFVTAWAGFAALRVSSAPRSVHAAVVVALLAGSLAVPADPVGLKRTIEARPDVELLEVRDELRALGDDGFIAMTFGSRSSRNFVAYVMRSGGWTIHSGAEAADVGWLVISMRDEPWSERSADIETDSLVIHVAQPSDLES